LAAKRILVFFLAFPASALLLTLIQEPFGFWPLAWVSLVPFILVCSPEGRLRDSVIISYFVSFFYWLGNLYWMGYVTLVGWLAFCIYTAILWPLLVVGLRFCRRKRIPLFLAVPVLFVGAERLQGLFLGGFFWRHLAHSQYANVVLIQIADIFGAAGVSFLVGMVNGQVAELVLAARGRALLKTRVLVQTAIVCCLMAGAIVYGQWRINESDKFVESGPVVASVQSNVPQSVKQSFEAEDAIFVDLVEQSRQAAEAGAELIVWPETMAQAILEPQVLRLLEPSHPYKVFDEAIRELAEGRAFMLVGAYGRVVQITEDFDMRVAQKYNSAFLYKPDGSEAAQTYRKIHLVPFGEVLPFRNIAWLHNLLIKIGPYDFDYTLDAGSEYTAFEMAGGQEYGGRAYRFSVLICYEDAVPELTRRFVLDEKGGKRIDWLVNISNDGWFVRFKNGRFFPSTELAQHTAICVFRAVENRLCVVRSVNTGISCLIDTAGRIRDGFLAGNLPRPAMERTACAGWFAERVPIDKRITVFSRYGQWLDFLCAVCFFLIIILPPSAKYIRNKKYARAGR
jgi:apolipoprotein N-acyltransferase